MQRNRSAIRRHQVDQGGGVVPPAVPVMLADLPSGVSASMTLVSGLAWKDDVGAATPAPAFTSGQAMTGKYDASYRTLLSFAGYQNRLGMDTGTYGPANVRNFVSDRLSGKFPTYVAATGNYDGPSGATGTSMTSGGNGAEAGQGRYVSPSRLSGGGVSSSRAWIRGRSDGPNGLPAVTGLAQALSSPTNYATVLSTDTTWKLVFCRGSNVDNYFEHRPTGFGSGLGDTNVWGVSTMQRAGGVGVSAALPLIDEETGGQVVSLTGAALANVYDPVTGTLDFAITAKSLYGFVSDWFRNQGAADTQVNIFSIDFANGATARGWAQYGNGNSSYQIKFRVDDGVDASELVATSAFDTGHTDGILSGPFLAEVYFRFRFSPTEMLIRRGASGAMYSDFTSANPDATLVGTSIDEMRLGDDIGGVGQRADVGWGQIAGMVGQSLDELAVEALVLGDSNAGVYAAGLTLPPVKGRVADYMYTAAQAQLLNGGRAGIRSLAVQGYTLADMLSGRPSSFDTWAAAAPLTGLESVVIDGYINTLVGDGTTIPSLATIQADFEARFLDRKSTV